MVLNLQHERVNALVVKEAKQVKKDEIYMNTEFREFSPRPYNSILYFPLFCSSSNPPLPSLHAASSLFTLIDKNSTRTFPLFARFLPPSNPTHKRRMILVSFVNSRKQNSKLIPVRESGMFIIRHMKWILLGKSISLRNHPISVLNHIHRFCTKLQYKK